MTIGINIIPSAGIAAVTEIDCGTSTPKLSGTIQSLSKFVNLERFSTINHELTGSIPNLENCTLLKEFNVSENNFSGNFPILSANLDLEIFDITNNSIAGPMHRFLQIII
jgi:hypothetical protein